MNLILVPLLVLLIVGCSAADTSADHPTEGVAIDASTGGPAQLNPSAPTPTCEPFVMGGCVSAGCPAGKRCDVSNACTESKCSCDASGHWICTADCTPPTCV